MTTSKNAASREFLKQVWDQFAANVLPIIIKTAREAAWSAVLVTDILNPNGRY
jgi:hypothetical protein